MKIELIEDGAFDRAWNKLCPKCKNEPSSILWFKSHCHKCQMELVAKIENFIKQNNEKNINLFNGCNSYNC